MMGPRRSVPWAVLGGLAAAVIAVLANLSQVMGFSLKELLPNPLWRALAFGVLAAAALVFVALALLATIRHYHRASAPGANPAPTPLEEPPAAPPRIRGLDEFTRMPFPPEFGCKVVDGPRVIPEVRWELESGGPVRPWLACPCCGEALTVRGPLSRDRRVAAYCEHGCLYNLSIYCFADELWPTILTFARHLITSGRWRAILDSMEP